MKAKARELALTPLNNQGKYSFVPHQTFRLIINCYTWHRDSHGLFDYEGKDVEKSIFKSNGTRKFLKQAQVTKI